MIVWMPEETLINQRLLKNGNLRYQFTKFISLAYGVAFGSALFRWLGEHRRVEEL